MSTLVLDNILLPNCGVAVWDNEAVFCLPANHICALRSSPHGVGPAYMKFCVSFTGYVVGVGYDSSKCRDSHTEHSPILLFSVHYPLPL